MHDALTTMIIMQGMKILKISKMERNLQIVGQAISNYSKQAFNQQPDPLSHRQLFGIKCYVEQLSVDGKVAARNIPSLRLWYKY